MIGLPLRAAKESVVAAPPQLCCTYATTISEFSTSQRFRLEMAERGGMFPRRIQRIIVELKVYISGKISEDQRGFNVGKLGFQLMNNLGSHEVKRSITAQEKSVRALSNKITNDFSQQLFT